MGKRRHSKRIRGCQITVELRGCSIIQAPPMATAAITKSAVLRAGWLVRPCEFNLEAHQVQIKKGIGHMEDGKSNHFLGKLPWKQIWLCRSKGISITTILNCKCKSPTNLSSQSTLAVIPHVQIVPTLHRKFFVKTCLGKCKNNTSQICLHQNLFCFTLGTLRTSLGGGMRKCTGKSTY